MHGTLSAGILIGVFGAVAAAGFYVALRLFLAGGRRAGLGASVSLGANASMGASTNTSAGPEEQ
jgi:hypothetical protein